ncbi:hypothetical protein K0M31_006676 [Melipona bicolor]|uniref:Uncharacterized protein n=1 Tax=Melipona bicolor TaxID=60889 RepID=A0AA40KL04_9HYME|nr:hypothetical protein K0M31_006676 [Melipona bicolor]
MNGNVTNDPKSNVTSTFLDKSEKQNLLPPLNGPVPVIVKVSKSTNSSFKSR